MMAAAVFSASVGKKQYHTPGVVFGGNRRPLARERVFPFPFPYGRLVGIFLPSVAKGGAC